METLTLITQIAAAVTAISSAALVLIKPIRNKAFGMRDIYSGQRCLLRAEMLKLYYKHCDTQTIRQYESENFTYMYEAYKAMGGNSFIDTIYNEVRTWRIVS